MSSGTSTNTKGEGAKEGAPKKSRERKLTTVRKTHHGVSGVPYIPRSGSSATFMID